MGQGSLREIVETIHNWPTTGLRVNVYSRSADARETGKSRAMMGDVGTEHDWKATAGFRLSVVGPTTDQQDSA